MTVVFFLTITLAAVISLVATEYPLQEVGPRQKARRWVHRLTLFNYTLFLMVVVVALVWIIAPPTVLAAGPSQQEQSVSDPYASLAAALAAGVACIGAGLAVSSTGSAAIGTIAERPEAFGRALIFVGLAEGIAIYGLIIAFMILSR
jgi:V/A-type H+-transporting ATPase subunit K